MIGQVAYFNRQITLLAKIDHGAVGVEVLVSKIIILESFVELLAIVAVVFRILRLFFWRGRLLSRINLVLNHHFFNNSSFLFNLLLYHFYYLRFEMLYLRVHILVSHLFTDFGHKIDSCRSNIAILIFQKLLAKI